MFPRLKKSLKKMKPFLKKEKNKKKNSLKSSKDLFQKEIIYRKKSGRLKIHFRLTKIQEILSNIGTVNLRSLEVYDSIKKDYDEVKGKAETIEKEKEGILKIIHEIDIKKKKTFLKTLT